MKAENPHGIRNGTFWRVAVRGTGRNDDFETFASRVEATTRAIEMAETMNLDAIVIDWKRLPDKQEVCPPDDSAGECGRMQPPRTMT